MANNAPQHINTIGSLHGFTLTDEAADAWAEVFIDMAATKPDAVIDNTPIEIITKPTPKRRKNTNTEPNE